MHSEVTRKHFRVEGKYYIFDTRDFFSRSLILSVSKEEYSYAFNFFAPHLFEMFLAGGELGQVWGIATTRSEIQAPFSFPLDEGITCR